VPALIGDDLALPWDGQNLSIFSVSSNSEVARVRSRDDVIGWARREGPSLWFGARALYRFDRSATAGTREGSSRYALSRDDLPGGAPFALDGYTSLRAGADARERVRLLWRPDPASVGARLAGDTVYALFHQVVFGLDARDADQAAARERHQPDDRRVILNNRQLSPRAQQFEQQFFGGLRGGGDRDRTNRRQRFPAPHEHVEHMHHPNNLIGRVAINRHAAVAGLCHLQRQLRCG
jgi:hypothetical protein